MAKNNIKSLNPLAPPYLKSPPTLCYIHTFPVVYLRTLQPVISYNVHRLTKSLPPPPPVKKNFPLTPVPCGPRGAAMSRGRRVNKLVRSGELIWRPKPAEENKATIPKQPRVGGRKRWKNTSADYHQTLPLESETTSLMIKNIPNKYTRELLILTLDNHCKNENNKTSENEFISAYDHVYLPIDFKSRVNAGFAFVNFTNAKAAVKFKDAFHGKRWAFSDSPKVAEISRAKIQGIKAIIKHCQMMDFKCASDEDLPVIFEPARDGSGRFDSKMFKLGKFVK
ncbi:putative mei2/Mei2-like RNA recognition, nucleotide-binding alpha-beta plait domain superfamily [Helianthus anomalus]